MKIVNCPPADAKSGEYMNTICTTYREHLAGGILKESLLFHVDQGDGTLRAYAYAKGWQGDPDENIFEDYEADDPEECHVHGADYSDDCLCCDYLMRQEYADKLTFSLLMKLDAELPAEERIRMIFRPSKALKAIHARYSWLLER